MFLESTLTTTLGFWSLSVPFLFFFLFWKQVRISEPFFKLRQTLELLSYFQITMASHTYDTGSSEYTKLCDNGRKALDQMLSAIDKPKRFISSRRLRPHYYAKGLEQKAPTKLPTDTTKRLLREAKTPVDDFRIITILNDPRFGARSSQPIYVNAVHDNGCALVCLQNYKANDALNGQPEQLFWSDLVAAACEKMMLVQGRQWATMANIETI